MLGYVFYLNYIGGQFLRQKAKANLLPFKNKGAWIEFIKKDGRTYLYYIIIGQNNKIELKGITYMLDEFMNILKDQTEIIYDKDGNLRPTKNYYDGSPKYFIVEGCPTNVLVKARDYDQDITKLKEISITLKKIIESKNLEDAKKYKEKLVTAFYNLYNSDLKYTPSVNVLIRDLIETERQYQTAVNEDGSALEYTDLTILEAFDKKLLNIIREMNLRNKTTTNFSEYFNNGKLSEIYAKHTSFAYLLGILKAGALDMLKKMMTWLIILLVCGILFLGYVGIDTQKKMEKLDEKLNIIMSDTNSIKDSIGQMDIFTNIIDANVVNAPTLHRVG